MESKKSKEVKPKKRRLKSDSTDPIRIPTIDSILVEMGELKIRLNKAEQMIQKLDNWLDGCTYERESKKSWWESLWKK